MRINASGNVGIGTTAPGSILDVQGASIGASFAGLIIRDAAAERMRVGYNTGAAPTAGLVSPQILYGQVESSGGLMLATRGNVQAGMGFYTSPDAGVTGLVERIRISGSGNVGIGTTAPNEKLEVFGGNVRSALVGASAATLRGFVMASDSTEFASLKSEASAGETRLTSGFAGFGGLTTFHTNGSEKMRITSDGTLLLGTTTTPTSATTGVLAFGAVGTAPSAVSAGGALYVDSGGILKYRNSTGLYTVTIT
jgi:hypothetical protein